MVGGGAAEPAVAESPADPSSPAPKPPAPESFVRKEKVEVLRPLPDDPSAALRELMPAADAVADSQEGGPAVEAASEANDVGYIRRLCAATGGFLPPGLRAVVWSLLLGRGRRPVDEGFVRWRAQRRESPPSSLHGAATIAYKLDLRNDCLALARRLCDEDGAGGAAAGSGSARDDPEALALDIEEVCKCGVWKRAPRKRRSSDQFKRSCRSRL